MGVHASVPHETRRQLAGFGVVVLMVTALALMGADTAADFPRVWLQWPGGAGPARLAARDHSRALGYRRIALERAPPAIYFRYPKPQPVHFHMRGVSFPVRAYWLGPDGCVLGWTDMTPGVSGYQPPAPVIAVLEVPHAFLEHYPLNPGDCVRVRSQADVPPVVAPPQDPASARDTSPARGEPTRQVR